MKVINQKGGIFTLFYVFLRKFFAVLTTFWWISAKNHELLASILCFWRPHCAVIVHIYIWRPHCAVSVHIVLLASILCCWPPYCAVGVHIVMMASILCCWRPYYAVGVYIALLASTLCCWRPYCAVGVHIMLLASILCCWRPNCAVGIHIVLRVFMKVTFGISRKSKIYTKIVLFSWNFEQFRIFSYYFQYDISYNLAWFPYKILYTFK